MSQERIEAAAKSAYVEYSQEPNFDAEAAWEDMNGTEDWEQGLWVLVGQSALAAADAVMFSDEAIERVAVALWNHDFPSHPIENVAELLEWTRGRRLEQARLMVAALKGEQ